MPGMVSTSARGCGSGSMVAGAFGPATATDPSISGSATEAVALTGVDMTGHGTVTSRKWQRSYDGSTVGVDIPSATSSSYTLKYEDVGNYVRYANYNGTTWYYSSWTSAVTAISVPNTTPASPATRDVTDVTIEAGGWSALVTVKGWAGSAGSITYSYGDEAAGTSKFRVKVFSEGYDSAGNLKVIERTVYGTKTIRKAYPSHASLNEATSGSDEVIRVALSDFVYADDNTGAGKSGRAPIVTIDAGWATYSGNGSTATYLTCTNNSTAAYPTAVASWDEYVGVIHKDRVQSDFVLACNAVHRLGVSCVRFDATGQTSAVNSNAYVTSLTKTIRSKTSLYGQAYQTTITLSAFTQAELIDCRFRVYPKVGDASAIIDTNSYTASTDECLGANKATITCDKSAALDVIKYVATTGNDSTGDGSSGNPYLTIGKAMGVGANIVRLKAGTHNLFGSAPASPTSSEWVVIRPDTGQDYTTVTVQHAASNQNPVTTRTRITGCTISLASTSSWPDGQAGGSRHIRYDNCYWNKGAVGAPTVFVYRFDSCRIHNCWFATSTTKWSIAGFSTTNFGLMTDGTDYSSYTGSGGEAFDGVYWAKCCIADNKKMLPPTASNGLPDPENCGLWWNKIMNWTSAGSPVFAIGIPGVTPFNCARGYALVGNVLEYNGSTDAALNLWSDSTANTSNNVIVWHNTVVGERANICYNDAANKAHTNWSVRFNSFDNANIKSDIFATNGANVGNWPGIYGVGWEGNRALGANDTAFGWEYGGRDCPAALWPAYGGTVTSLADANYTSNRSAAGTDAGNGNYLPTAGSDLLAVVPSGRNVVDYDLLGTAGDDAGAIFA